LTRIRKYEKLIANLQKKLLLVDIMDEIICILVLIEIVMLLTKVL